MSEWVSERASEWVSEWVSDWVTESVSEWVSERGSDWVSEWVSEWVSTEVTLLSRNLVKIDINGHTNIEDIRQSRNRLVERPEWHVENEKVIEKRKSEGSSRIAKLKQGELPYVK